MRDRHRGTVGERRVEGREILRHVFVIKIVQLCSQLFMCYTHATGQCYVQVQWVVASPQTMV